MVQGMPVPADAASRVEPAWRDCVRTVQGQNGHSHAAFLAFTDATPAGKAMVAAVFAADPEQELPTAPAAIDEQDSEPALNLVSWADKRPEAVKWLPGGYSAGGGLTINAGDGGIGKTRLTMSEAAARSQGQRWPRYAPPCPDGEELHDVPRGILFVGAEDAIHTTLLPSFLACGGDPKYAASIESLFVPKRDGTGRREVGFDLSERAMEALDRTLATGEYIQIFVDGLTGYIQGDGKGDTETRRSLIPLARLLRKYDVAGTGLMHFNKGAKKASDKLIMSVAFRNVARCVYFVVPDPAEFMGGKPDRVDYRRLVFCEKVNGGRIRDPFGYRIADTPVPGSSFNVGAVVWDDAEVACSLNEAVAAADALPETEQKRENLPQAVLRTILLSKGGRAPSEDVYQLADAMGVSKRTLERAKDALGITSHREGFGAGGRFFWCLPAFAPATEPIQ